MRWLVRNGDGATLREILTRARADGDALREGRVFVVSAGRRRRARIERELVGVGDVVEVAPRRESDSGVRILVRAPGLVAAEKAAGVPTIADHAGSSHALVALVARALGITPSRVHPTSRLDRDVSGVVFFALTREAAARLARARAQGGYERRYVAITSRAPAVDRGEWDAPIGRARDPRLRAVGGRDARTARTRFAVVAVARTGATMLAIEPLTGRTHQIRAHASHAGVPLLGDRAYGGPARLTLDSGRVIEPRRIALHAARVAVPGARRGDPPIVAESPIPQQLRSLWSALGGDASAWQRASSCALESL